ncbi:HEAT repeat domain-containing protein [Zeaxanthinibacter enoshimensis]|uniref:HEAT repeat protein n=1 Tax=Zeaxanthinibacter enoshimensis TaxID=392009 RepID=A0A4R6TSH9_9FLAO|nr:HEAT repeat domain-containing protein [Zeaxanthinibacter enoshimensis]TDQ31420.1 HEAT repeat protein [Zeaxanthinibacter enoshimensis]
MQAAIVPRYILNASPFYLEMTGYLTVGFALIAILLLFIVFQNRRSHSRKTKDTAARKKTLAPMVSTFLFYENEGSKEDNVEYVEMKIGIREMLKDKGNRVVLAEILMDLQKDISGDAQERLLALYTDLELHFDAFNKLSSWRWEIISQGILELSRMKVDKAYTFIRPFVNDRRSVIRKQAQIATVSLRKEGINYFLDTAKYAISEWQQLKLLDIIREKEDFTPPKFRLWLTSRNTDVVLFALRLVRFYKQTDANNALLRLLRHKNDQIKLEALECIKEFCVLESLEVLKEIYPDNKAEIKRTILDTIGFLGSEDEIPFLEKVIFEEKDFMVRSKAISSLNEIRPDSVLPEDHLKKPANEDLTVETETPEEIDDQVLVEIEEPGIELDTVEDSITEDHLEEEAVAEEPVLEMPVEIPIEAEEDLEIFDICLRESLDELILEARESEGLMNPRGILSLDFLPFISEEESSEQQNPDLSADEFEAIMHMETVYEILESQQADTSAEELEDIPLDTLLEPHGIALEDNRDHEAADVAEAPGKGVEEPGMVIDFSPEPAFHQSIFSELFLRCDMDSKLMLLDEMLAVGDEKELEYLDFLIAEEKGPLREKAIAVRKKLADLLESFPILAQDPEAIGENEVDESSFGDEKYEDAISAGGFLELNFEPGASAPGCNENAKEESADTVAGSIFNCLMKMMK